MTAEERRLRHALEQVAHVLSEEHRAEVVRERYGATITGEDYARAFVLGEAKALARLALDGVDVGGLMTQAARAKRLPSAQVLEAVRDAWAVDAADTGSSSLEAQIVAFKLRALAAHEAIWRAMRAQPHPALADDGEVHEAVHAILAVETESVIAPDEWKAHIERQDRRIERLEADLAKARGETELTRMSGEDMMPIEDGNAPAEVAP